MRRVRLLIGLAALLGPVVGASAPAAAAPVQITVPSVPGAERIVSFDSAIEVRRDGSVAIAETIVYDFGALRRHGIERFVPTRFAWTGDPPADAVPGASFDRVTPMDDIAVAASAGTPADLEVSQESDLTRLRIGDPDVTITGRHTYTIRYVLRGVLNGFEDHDELYLNVTGNQWEVPIETARATVSMPATVTQVACFAGPGGANLPCRTGASDGARATFDHGYLSPGAGLTVVVAVPRGVVTDPDTTRILDERWSPATAFRATPATLGGGLGVLALGLIGIGALGWRRGRDRRFAGSAVDAAFGNATGADEPVPLGRRDPDTVEFVPPEGIRPGHLGTLWDEHAHPLDVSAMIVDLAVRGHLRIDEIEPPSDGFLGLGRHGGDHQLVKLREPGSTTGTDALTSAETVLMTGLFRDGPVVRLSDLKTQFSARLALVESALYDDAVRFGWFPTRPDRVRQRWVGRGVLLTVLGAAVVAAAATFTHLGLVALPLPLLGLVLVVAARWFPARTAHGTALLGRVRGFKELFDAGEGERQRFAEEHGLFAKYLPYAIVFGCTQQWAETFAALGATPQEMGLGSWYTSPYGYDPIRFGWAMGSFTTHSTGAMAAAAPSSSGGASSGGSGFGGGFSGGGFGGGGGGSW